jgi:hypothetical protein
MEVPMKKSDVLSTQRTIDFAKQYYGQRKTLSGQALIDHCVLVARQAELIAQKLYQDVRADFLPDSTKDSIAAIVHGALLHDVMQVSDCAFENVAETTTVQIAAMVADISRDFRLVETKRDMEFRGRVSQSPVGSQIIVAADIICTAREAAKVLEASGVAVVPAVKKILTQLDGDLLAIYAANRYYMLRLYVHAARNMLNDISQKIKECKQQAKMARHAANSMQRLKEKLAAKAKDKPTTVKKKRSVRYAKKRTADDDSQ